MVGILAGVAAAFIVWCLILLNRDYNSYRLAARARDHHGRLWREVQRYLESVGVDLDPTVAIIAGGCIVLAAITIAYLLGMPLYVDMLMGVLILALAFLLIKIRLERQNADFNSQLADALPVIAGSLRSGMSLAGAIESFADSAQQPIKGEFDKVKNDLNAGIGFSRALENVSERMSSRPCHMLSVTVAVSTETGSALADILDKLAATIKENERLVKKADSLTSANRASAKLLTIMPIGLFAFFNATQEDFRKFYFGPEGFKVTVILACMIITGNLILKRLTTIDLGEG